MATKSTPNTAEPAATSSIPEWVMGGGADAKLAWIQGTIGNVDKTGRNDHQKFDYFQEHGIFAVVKAYLLELHVTIKTSVVNVGRDGNMTFGDVVIELVDCDQPALLEGGQLNPLRQTSSRYHMEATDKNGWGAAKLLTYASKFAYQKFLNIPTEQLPEAEREAIEHIKGGGSRPRPITVEEIESLTTALRAATPEDEVGRARFLQQVAGKLKADFGVDQVAELKDTQLEAFRAWVVQATAKAAA